MRNTTKRPWVWLFVSLPDDASRAATVLERGGRAPRIRDSRGHGWFAVTLAGLATGTWFPPKCPGDIYIIAKGSLGKKLNAWIYLFLPVKMATLVIHYKKLHKSKWNICLWAKTVLTGESLCSRHCNRVTDTTRKQKCFYI